MTYRSIAWQILTLILIALIYLATRISEDTLRDPRFIDGWFLTAAFCFQLMLNMGIKFSKDFVEKKDIWVTLHTYCGFLTVAVFIFHAELQVPDNSLEWAMWLFFSLLIVCGVAGKFLRPSTFGVADTDTARQSTAITDQRLTEMGIEAERLADKLIDDADSRTISNFFINTIYPFLMRRQNWFSALKIRSRTEKTILFQVDDLKHDLTGAHATELNNLKGLIKEKFDFDRQSAINKLSRIIYMLHITSAYSLCIIVLAHIIIVSAFSSGIP